MNVSLLRLASNNGSGIRVWKVPGEASNLEMWPASLSQLGTITMRWPRTDSNGDYTNTGARMDWHRSLVKREIAHLVAKII